MNALDEELDPPLDSEKGKRKIRIIQNDQSFFFTILQPKFGSDDLIEILFSIPCLLLF